MSRPAGTHAGQSIHIPTTGSQSILTTVFIANLHCPSCVQVIQRSLAVLEPQPTSVSVSIVSHSVTVTHSPSLQPELIEEALDAAGFELHSRVTGDRAADHPQRDSGLEWADSLDQAVFRWRESWRHSQLVRNETARADSKPKRPSPLAEFAESTKMVKNRTHAAQCAECQAEANGLPFDDNAIPLTQVDTFIPGPGYSSQANSTSKKYAVSVEHKELKDDLSSDDDPFVVVDKAGASDPYKMEISIVGMTCSACTGAVTRAAEALPFVKQINVSLLTNSAVIEFNGKQHAEEVVEAVEDAGFDATMESLEQLTPQSSGKGQKKNETNLWKAEYAIGGMTCSACVGSITQAVSQLNFVENVNINLISNSGTVVFEGEKNVAAITEAIEDAGFDVSVEKVEKLDEMAAEDIEYRTVYIKIADMYCHHCPKKIVRVLQHHYGESIEIMQEPTEKEPILKIRYIARPPVFTIRHILTTINSVDDSFNVSIYHPPTIEDKSKAMQIREHKRLLFRLALTFTIAIPTFIIGIVCMMLIGEHSPAREYIMTPMWSGMASRAEWALFILATPVYFFAADHFHRKTYKEIKALWRPGSTTPFIKRFTRFGSMNMLMSLGTSISYFASIAELGIAASRKQHNEDAIHHGHPMPAHNEHEQMAMGQTSQVKMSHPEETSTYFDSVVFLTMFLLLGRYIEAYSKAKTGDAVSALGKLRPDEAILIEETDVAGRKLSIDLLDVGDIILVPNGASPPFDGVVVDGSAQFDESSLTGESRLVPKEPGESVFAGTINKTGPVSIRLTSVSGSSMLDQIIKIVREGQTKRAPVERIADVITSHFVPVVVAIGITTWVVWLSLGTSGVLPQAWIEGKMGGWGLWSLRFAITVFVVACPCGIGLAAPTALFVGGGMAAKHGILVKGGGEAFQEASTLDCVVFDKTGTLTSGGDPTVVDYRALTDDDEREFLGMIKRMEENSGHPIAKAVVSFCTNKKAEAYVPNDDIQEIAGKGMFGSFKLEEGPNWRLDVEVIVGNERLMQDHNVMIDRNATRTLQAWKKSGNSVVLVALRAISPYTKENESTWILTALFAIADSLRPESRFIVKALQERDIAVWMLSGDNPDTARAIGQMVGIYPECIIAGVLPDQKAEKIQHLQKTLPPKKGKERALVAMVGDGINDSPALTMADVGIAIGSGSDVAISSAEFILISSNLSAIITLIDLSRAVFRRVWFNFAWAGVYNMIALPVAVGVFYPIQSNGKHITLDPVWAALAMALSSISVICSSLMLRTTLPLVGFKSTLPKNVVIKEEPAKIAHPNRRSRIPSMPPKI